MESEPLSESVRALLRDRVETFEQLKILLLLRQGADRAWTPESVAKKLNLPLASVGEALDHLCRRNLLDVRVGEQSLVFRYAPGTTDLDRAVTDLAEAQMKNEIEVMKVMSANAVERVRLSALRLFSDAFLIGNRRGRKKDE